MKVRLMIKQEKSYQERMLELKYGMSIEKILLRQLNKFPSQRQAAMSLGVNRQTFINWVRKHNLEIPQRYPHR